MKTGTVRFLHHIAIFFGILFLLWGVCQWQTYTLSKDVGVDGTGTLVTEQVPPGAIMTVHTTSSNRMDTRVVRMDAREEVYVGNDTYYDQHLIAGGPPGNGVGKDVSMMASSLTPTRYMILVKAPTEATIDYTEADVSYKVDVFIWTPSFLLLITGFILIFCTMTLGTVLGIGIFGPGVYRPKGAPAPMRAGEPRQTPPIERTPPPVITAPPARRAPPPAVPPPEPAFEPRYEVQAEELPPPAPAPAPARRGEPMWDVSPAPVQRAAAPAPVAQEARAPLKKIKCSACGAVIPIYTNERPLRVTCPLCGRQGTLR